MSYLEAAKERKLTFEGFTVNEDPMLKEVKLAQALKALREKNEEKEITNWYNSYLINFKIEEDEELSEYMIDLGHSYIMEMHDIFCKINNYEPNFNKFINLIYKCSKVSKPERLCETLFKK